MAKNYGEDLYGNESDACSFCGAKRRDGAILLSSSKGCNICSKCIAKGYQMLIDNDVLHDEAASRRKEKKNTSLKFEDLLKPNEIKEFLDQYVIGQDDAKRYMSVAVLITTSGCCMLRARRAKWSSTSRTSCWSARRVPARR